MSMQFGKTEEEFVHNRERRRCCNFSRVILSPFEKDFFDTYSMGLFLCNKLGQMPTRRGTEIFFRTNVTFQDH